MPGKSHAWLNLSWMGVGRGGRGEGEINKKKDKKRKGIEIVQSCEESLIENLNRNDAGYVSCPSSPVSG